MDILVFLTAPHGTDAGMKAPKGMPPNEEDILADEGTVCA